MNFYKLRKNIYKHQSNFNLKIGIDINNFKNSPHAYLKTIFNVEIASVLT